MVQIYIELQNNAIHPVVFELIGKAKELYNSSNKKEKGNITAFCACKLSKKHETELKQYGISKIYYLNTQVHHFYYDIATQAFSKAIDISIKNDNTSIILIGGTKEGHLLASSLGVIKHTGITAECTDLYLNDNNKLVQVRPAFSGNLMAEIITPYTELQIATVHENIFAKAEKCETNSIEYIAIDINNTSKIEILDETKIESSSNFQDITKSEKLVIIGNGIANKEELEPIIEFAKSIGASLAGTKLAVQKGLIPREHQVGLSGHTVSPKLAILLGVSGSLQFLAGIANAKKIIAINSDKNADIMKIAHHPICGNAVEIIQYLL